MRPLKTAWLPVLVGFFVGGVTPTHALDLYVSNVPPIPSAIVTPQIDNIGTLKRYHLKDQETAEDLQVSCFVGASQNCVLVFDGDIAMFVPGPLPSSVEVEFSLINSTDDVIRSVTDTYDVTWTASPLNPTCSGVGTVLSYTAQISSTMLPLSGLELPVGTYRVKARVDPNNLQDENDETNNTRPSDDSFSYAIYSGDLIYGPITTTLTELVKTGLCLVGTTSVSMGSVAEWDHEWGTSEFNPTPGCYNFATNTDGYSIDLIDHAGINPVAIGTLTGPTPSGMDACLLGVTLDELGAHYAGA
ncbi:MAG: hypothetical protein KC978_20165, partial [Candidatus Omnitrophica bacterium]|nr:hypothetical protein [Candidatus Omnitrophota bacterium]